MFSFVSAPDPKSQTPDPGEEFTQHDADMLAEEAGGAPINYGSTAKAILALETRILYLKARIAAIEEQEIPGGPTLDNLLLPLHSDLKRAQADLAHYQALTKQQN